MGLAEYLAPEIQKKVCGEITLKNAPLPTFTKETDLFALAVHVFCLLMGGSHPFACAKRANGQLSNTMEQMAGEEIGESVVAPQPIENIKSGFFPFWNYKYNIDIPAYAPEFVSLHPHLQKLFVKTFVDGYKNPKSRVQASEWLGALKPLIEGFDRITQRCGKSGHYYFSHNMECPYCHVEQKQRELLQELAGQNQGTSGTGFTNDSGSDTGGGQWNGVFAKQPPKKKQGKEKGAWLSVAVFYIVLVVVLLFVAIMLSV